ncbi:MAG TPA: hypothetical protein VGD64_00785 [Acidisarcina sp.]
MPRLREEVRVMLLGWSQARFGWGRGRIVGRYFRGKWVVYRSVRPVVDEYREAGAEEKLVKVKGEKLPSLGELRELFGLLGLKV